MNTFQPRFSSLNKNNGEYSTIDNAMVEGFETMTSGSGSTPAIDPSQPGFLYSDFGYSSNNYDLATGTEDPKLYARDAVEYQIKPLQRLNERFNHLDQKIGANKASLEANYAKYVRLRDQLEEIPITKERTINVGVSPDSSKLYYEVPDVDMSYQRLKVPATVDKTNEASNGVSFNSNDTFSVVAEGKTLIIQKTNDPNIIGWNADMGYTNGLSFNIGVESIPDKKYFHHKDDPLEIDRRKNQREQHMADTKELLLYTNQFYIIGTISTALVLIFAYRNVV